MTALCPGPVRTEFTQMARRESQNSVVPAPELAHVPVEKVVAAALGGVERNSPIVIPGGLMKFGMAIVRLMPLFILRLASRFSAKRA